MGQTGLQYAACAGSGSTNLQLLASGRHQSSLDAAVVSLSPLKLTTVTAELRAASRDNRHNGHRVPATAAG